MVVYLDRHMSMTGGVPWGQRQFLEDSLSACLLANKRTGKAVKALQGSPALHVHNTWTTTLCV